MISGYQSQQQNLDELMRLYGTRGDNVASNAPSSHFVEQGEGGYMVSDPMPSGGLNWNAYLDMYNPLVPTDNTFANWYGENPGVTPLAGERIFDRKFLSQFDSVANNPGTTQYGPAPIGGSDADKLAWMNLVNAGGSIEAMRQDTADSNSGWEGFLNQSFPMMAATALVGGMVAPLAAASGSSSYLGAAGSVAKALANDNPLSALTGLVGPLSGALGGSGIDTSWGVNQTGGNMGDWTDMLTGPFDMDASAGIFDSWGNPLFSTSDGGAFDMGGSGGIFGSWGGGFSPDPGFEQGVFPDSGGFLPDPGFESGDLSTGSDWGGIIGKILSGGGKILGSLGSGAGSLINTLFGGQGGGGLSSWLPALLGGVLGGTQGQPGPITSTIKPLNQGAVDQAMQNALNIGTPPSLPIADDRFLQNAISAAIDPMTRDFQNRIMPGIRTEFGDQYGSTKNQQALGLATEALARQQANTGAQMSQVFYPWMFGTQQQAVQWPWEQQLNAIRTQSGAVSNLAGTGRVAETQLPETPWWQSALGGALQAQSLWNTISNPTGVKT